MFHWKICLSTLSSSSFFAQTKYQLSVFQISPKSPSITSSCHAGPSARKKNRRRPASTIFSPDCSGLQDEAFHVYSTYIYIANMLRTNTLSQHQLCQCTFLQHLGSTRPWAFVCQRYKRRVQQQLQQSVNISCLDFHMDAEQWSWKHPGELQQLQ